LPGGKEGKLFPSATKGPGERGKQTIVADDRKPIPPLGYQGKKKVGWGGRQASTRGALWESMSRKKLLHWVGGVGQGKDRSKFLTS